MHAGADIILGLAAFALCLGSFARGQETEKPQRARLPKWETFPGHVFFKDAFKDGLIGPRPAQLGRSSTPAASPGTQEETATSFAWDRIVSAETLEDEVKRLQIAMQTSVTTPSRFRGGGYQQVRRQFTELATLFAVIREYEGNVRWKKQATLARDLFARAAANAKVTSIQAFNEAKQRKLDLEELVRGGTLAATTKAGMPNDWEHICDRAPLMERFAGCFDEGIAIWSANSKSFSQNRDSLKRETELLRLFSVVLTRPGMQDAGDDDYQAYCRQLGEAAEQLLRTIEANDAAAARKAASNVKKSCVECHEAFRA